jgi:AraC-like DNA-binding protein
MNLNSEDLLTDRLAHGPLLRDRSASYPALAMLLAKLWELRNTQSGELEQASVFLQILMALRANQHTAQVASPLPNSLQAVLQDIDRNYLLIRNLSEITQRHFISPATLNRWFREHLHISPKAYLEYKKLSHAVALLSNGASVTEACFGSGFSDCSHFCAQFKKQFGQTPLQYKKRSE